MSNIGKATLKYEQMADDRAVLVMSGGIMTYVSEPARSPHCGIEERDLRLRESGS